MQWFHRLFQRRRRYDDLAVSIREHLEEKVEELIEQGMSRQEAETRARREFGNVLLTEERSREVWQWPTLESIWADVRFASRQLIKAPGFTATAVLTLSLGVAVNATMFSLVSAFLLFPVPGHNAQNLVVVSSVDPNQSDRGDTSAVSVPNYLAWRADKRVFAEMAAADEYRTASLTGRGQPQTVNYAAVSSNYFKLFGVAPQFGRLFTKQEDQPGAAHVVLLSHGLWAGGFGSDPSIIGRTIRLDREDYVVIGVMPAEFRLLGFVPQLWTPLTLHTADQSEDARKDRSLYLFARLAPGVTLQRARAELNILAKRAQEESPEIERRWGAAARTLPDFIVYNFGIRTGLAVLMTTVSFVLLIACANVAGLLLTRAAGRQKELAIRVSIGASRARIMRQLVTEGVVIALLGGCLGLLLTYFGISLLRANLSFNEAISAIPVTLDRNVLWFVLGVSLTSAALSSVAPAFKSARTDVNADLKSESRTASAGRSHSRLRAALVSGEIAVALFLLTGTGLLVRGISVVEYQKLGFPTDHLLTAGLTLDHAQYSDNAHQLRFVRELVSRLRDIPGANDVAVASDLPATDGTHVRVFFNGEATKHTNEERKALDVVVTSNYFRTAGIAMLRGRGFTDMVDGNAPRVVLVNQEFVHRYLHDKDPLGVQIRLDNESAAPGWSQIVGVVRNIKSQAEDVRVDPEVYESFSQRPIPSFSVMIKTNVAPEGLIPALRKTVSGIDTELPLHQVKSMDSVITYQRNGNPFFVRVLGSFAILALILAAVGIYGLVAYSARQRTHEIGIRMAVGANRSDILRMILREGFKTAAIGACAGLALALPLPRFFDSVFEGLHFDSPGLHLIAVAAILMVAGLATYVPALRAAQVDPKTALRVQ